MNVEKYRVTNCGLLAEADRTMYDKKDTVSHSIIDPTRTHLNYNLCPHPQYTRDQIRAKNEAIRGKKLASNSIAWASAVLTLPKDYTGDKREFFECAYEQLKKLYHIKDEDIISAYVHMDETSPHMHFYYIPVWRDKNNIDIVKGVNFNKIMSKTMYQTQHPKLKKAMEDVLHRECNIQNDETLGKDISSMNAEQRKASMELDATNATLSQVKEELISNQIANDELKDTVASLTKKVEFLDNKVKLDEQEIHRLAFEKRGLAKAIDDLIKNINEFITQRVKLGRKMNSPFIKNRDAVEERLEVLDDRHDAAASKTIESIDDVFAMDEAERRNIAALQKLDVAIKEDDFDFDEVDDMLR